VRRKICIPSSPFGMEALQNGWLGPTRKAFLRDSHDYLESIDKLARWPRPYPSVMSWGLRR
jgi:hypothetical protein